jgi:hypothetical protein
MRIKLLDRLSERDATVTEPQDAVGPSDQNVSKHLGILHGAGTVARTRSGQPIQYAISDPIVFELCDLVGGGLRRQLEELDAIVPCDGPEGRRVRGACR